MELKDAFDVLGNLGKTHVLWFAVAAVVLIITTSSALATLGSRNPFLNDPKCSRRYELSLWHHQVSSDVLAVNGNGGPGKSRTPFQRLSHQAEVPSPKGCRARSEMKQVLYSFKPRLDAGGDNSDLGRNKDH
jgi:hypothetical protein